MKYREDHMRVLSVLADELPKRPTFKISEIALKFKGRAGVGDADRAARNAIRKPRSEGHVEIAERGDYRLTAAGVAFMKDVEKKGYETAADRAGGKTKAKTLGKKAKTKATPAVVKATTKVKAKAAKATKGAKTAKATKAAKAPRVVNSNPSRVSRKKSIEASNGVSSAVSPSASDDASLNL